jgi:hypothetical protein
MSTPLPKSVVEFVLTQAQSDLYGAYCRNRLMDLLEGAGAQAGTQGGTQAGTEAASQEAATASLIENEIRQLLGDRASIERRPIGRSSAASEAHPQQHDLIVCVDDTPPGRPGLLFVADPDVPGPVCRPRSTADRVFGTGAAGNKAQTVLALAQMKLLAEVKDRLGYVPPSPLAYAFPIGHASADTLTRPLAADPRVTNWRRIVLTTTGGVPHTALPGVVTFTCGLSGADALEAFPFVVQAIDAEGIRLRNECRDETGSPDAWHAATQTNHGVLGSYGAAPAIMCDRLAVRLKIAANANPERIAMRITEVLDATLAEYLRHRTDLARQVDPATGEPKLKRHYALCLEPAADALVYRIDVFGRRARLGTPSESDSAISKAAFLFGALLQVRRSFPNVRVEAALADPQPNTSSGELVIRGVQTFGRPHDIAGVRRRLMAASQGGVDQYSRLRSSSQSAIAVTVRFDGHEREPFEQGPPNPAFEALRSAIESACLPATAGAVWPGLLSGDYAFVAGDPAVIFGAGRLDRLGTEHECVEIPDIQQSLAVATLAALAYPAECGS